MAGKTAMEGMEEVMSNLNKELREIEGKTTKGYIRASIHVRRQSEPKIPVDTGNLRSSWFVVSQRGENSKTPSFSGKQASELHSDHSNVTSSAKREVKKFKHPAVLFGFTANYAALVHEKVDDASFRRPGAQARFLFSTLSEEANRILEIIRENAKI